MRNIISNSKRKAVFRSVVDSLSFVMAAPTESRFKTFALLLDIEGTTTSISFVKDVLFPYARNNLRTFLEKTWHETEMQIDVAELKANVSQVADDKEWDVLETEIAVLRLMDADVKNTTLKKLQGRIWKEGYESKTLVGHIYDDVLPALKEWTSRSDQHCVFIYSSGSVQAQKLLFANTDYGNLLQYINGHFDTTVGAKNNTVSYKKIAEEIKLHAAQILFLTDVVAEARAAKEAGMQAYLVVRPGNAPLSQEDKHEFQTIATFEALSHLQ